MNENPRRPYIIKGWSDYRGASIERLLLVNYSYLISMKKRFEDGDFSSKSPVERHLEWALKRGEEVETRRYCPHCRENLVKVFAVYSKYDDVSQENTSCNQEDCIEKLNPRKGKVEILPFRFSTLKKFSEGRRKKEIISLFKWAFDLKKARKNEIFKLLCSCTCS